MADADNDTGLVCHFYCLPRELRDIIYSYAYADGRAVKVTMGRLACAALTTSITDRLTPRALCKDLHVDKQYLEEALPIFIRGLTFESDDVRNLATPGGRFPVVRTNITSISTCSTVLVDREADADMTTILRSHPRLECLTIRFRRALFEDVAIDTESETQLWVMGTRAGTCLAALRALSVKLQVIRGLKSFRMEFERAYPLDGVLGFARMLALTSRLTWLYVTLKPGQDIPGT